MIHNLVIEQASNKDSTEITQLIFDIWMEEFGFKVKSQDYPDFQDIEKYYLQRGGNFLVARTDKIVGTIACDKLENNLFVLKRMFVHKDFRGKGVAQLLLNLLMKYPLYPGTFFLSTKEDLALAAKKFYERNGFVRVEKESLPINFPFFYEDDLFMRKDIKEK